MFHKEGFKIILVAALIMVGGLLLIDNFIHVFWLQKSLMILLLVFFVLVLQFFRDPKRNTVLRSIQINDIDHHHAENGQRVGLALRGLLPKDIKYL